ncbi:MAG TPA: His-Xaa-Ser system radical SAM maturase HxsC [Armatimonadota bacterium]|nr:His-Xaa-Ser system radical SAM maturase HxsC [Armatimonadota bacterium]
MREYFGHPSKITKPVMGRITTKCKPFSFAKPVLVMSDVPKRWYGVGVVLTTTPQKDSHPRSFPCIEALPDEILTDLTDGDIVLIEPTGRVQQLWDVRSPHNIVMVTNSCNCRCMMCPQPSSTDSPDQLTFNLRMLQLISNHNVSSIGLTGGEPTLRINDLQTLIQFCKHKFPQTSLSLLSNGRAFCERNTVRKLTAIQHPHLTYCIALQSDVERIHDKIVGANGAFCETIKGLHHLALDRQMVEIRVVLMRENVARLPQLAEFIYRNFPFAIHIAFMGMETTGLAWEHLDTVWVDPPEYMENLQRAVQHLHQRRLHVSIYNIPKCLLPRELWKFSRDSISDWKKGFLPGCEGCVEHDNCSGIFTTSKKVSAGIAPIQNLL